MAASVLVLIRATSVIVRSGSASDQAHRAGGLFEVGFVDVVARLLLEDDAGDVVGDLGARGAGAHHVAQGVFDLREEARPDLAVGGEADARAGAAEGFGDGRDDADLAPGAVGEAVARGRLGAALGALRDEEEALVDALANLGAGDDLLARPAVPTVERHVLDEAHRDAVLARE